MFPACFYIRFYFFILYMVLLSEGIFLALIYKGECTIFFSSISVLLSVVFYVVMRTQGKFWPLQSSRGLSCCGVNDLATKSSESFFFFGNRLVSDTPSVLWPRDAKMREKGWIMLHLRTVINQENPCTHVRFLSVQGSMWAKMLNTQSHTLCPGDFYNTSKTHTLFKRQSWWKPCPSFWQSDWENQTVWGVRDVFCDMEHQWTV